MNKEDFSAYIAEVNPSDQTLLLRPEALGPTPSDTKDDEAVRSFWPDLGNFFTTNRESGQSLCCQVGHFRHEATLGIGDGRGRNIYWILTDGDQAKIYITSLADHLATPEEQEAKKRLEFLIKSLTNEQKTRLFWLTARRIRASCEKRN